MTWWCSRLSGGDVTEVNEGRQEQEGFGVSQYYTTTYRCRKSSKIDGEGFVLLRSSVTLPQTCSKQSILQRHSPQCQHPMVSLMCAMTQAFPVWGCSKASKQHWRKSKMMRKPLQTTAKDADKRIIQD
eukprot:2312961-Amphidinium_carterae.1